MLIIDSGDISVCSDDTRDVARDDARDNTHDVAHDASAISLTSDLIYSILDAIRAHEHPFIQTRTKYYHAHANIVVCWGGNCLNKETYINVVKRLLLNTDDTTDATADPTIELKLIIYFTHKSNKLINADIEADFTLKASEVIFNQHGTFDLLHLMVIRPELWVAKCMASHEDGDELSWRDYDNFKLYFRAVDTVFIYDKAGHRQMRYLHPDDADEHLIPLLSAVEYSMYGGYLRPTHNIDVSYVKSALKR